MTQDTCMTTITGITGITITSYTDLMQSVGTAIQVSCDCLKQCIKKILQKQKNCSSILFNSKSISRLIQLFRSMAWEMQQLQSLSEDELPFRFWAPLSTSIASCLANLFFNKEPLCDTLLFHISSLCIIKTKASLLNFLHCLGL